MIDIYNRSLAKYADNKRHIFTATFLRSSEHEAIFKDLTVDELNNVVVKQIALRYTKAFKELNLAKGDVIQFEALVKENKDDEFKVERPTKAEKIKDASEDESQDGVHVVSDDWNWFEE